MKKQVLATAALLAAAWLAGAPAWAQTGVGVKGDYDCVAPGQHTYTFDAAVPGGTYSWSIPAGWTVVSGGGPNQNSVVVYIPPFSANSQGSCPNRPTPVISVVTNHPQTYSLAVQLQLKPEAIGPTPTQGGSRFNVHEGGSYTVGLSNYGCFPTGSTVSITTNSPHFTVSPDGELEVNYNAPKGSLGSVVFRVTTPSGCSTLRSYQVYNPTNGPAPLRSGSAALAVYPNPVSLKTGLTQLSVATADNYTVQLIDPYGQTVATHKFSGTETQLNTAHLRQGRYSVVLLGAKGRQVQALLVE